MCVYQYLYVGERLEKYLYVPFMQLGFLAPRHGIRLFLRRQVDISDTYLTEFKGDITVIRIYVFVNNESFVSLETIYTDKHRAISYETNCVIREDGLPGTSGTWFPGNSRTTHTKCR